MPKKRLNELLKQRALLEEHLAWLESEIEAQQCELSPIEIPESPPFSRLDKDELQPVAAEPEAGPAEPDPKAVVADVYDELGPDTSGSVNSTRKGCITLFAIAFVVLAALVVWIYAKY